MSKKPAKRLVTAFVAPLLIVASPVFAEATVSKKEPEAILAAAIEEAQTAAKQRWAFTMTIDTKGSDGAMNAKVRFDPRRPKGERWTALSPTLEEMDKKQRKQFKKNFKGNDADEGLVYDGLSDSIASLQLVSVSEDRAVFAGPLSGEDVPSAMTDAVELKVSVNMPGAYIETIDMASSKPFKPAPIAKIEHLEQTATYERLPEHNNAVLSIRSQNATKGKAMLKSFDQAVTVAYSDFEAVDVQAEDETE